MSKINTHASGHGSRTENYAGGTSIQYNVFPNTSTKEKERLAKLTRAYDIINNLDTKIDLQGP